MCFRVVHFEGASAAVFGEGDGEAVSAFFHVFNICFAVEAGNGDRCAVFGSNAAAAREQLVLYVFQRHGGGTGTLDFKFDAHARAFGRGDFGDGVFKLDVQRQFGDIDADGVFLVGGEAGDQCQPFAVGFAYGHAACADGDVRHIAGADDGETVVDLAGGKDAAAHEDETAPPACIPVAIAALAVNVCPAVAVGVLMADVAVKGVAAAAVCVVVLLPAYAPAGAAHAAAGFVQGCLVAGVVFVFADACGG